MEKQALKPRKKSPDPLQQQLRDRKSNFNIACSEFISRVIAFKRGLNGRGDPNYGLPPSDIKNPLPGEIGGFLNQLASDFAKISSEANIIVSEQQNYSQKRNKKKQNPAEGAEPPKVAIVSSYTLEKYGSNFITRFLANIKSFFSKNDDKVYRMALLKASSELKDLFEDFQNDTLSLKIDSVPESKNSYQVIKYNLEAVNKIMDQIDNFAAKNISDDQKINSELHGHGNPDEMDNIRKELEFFGKLSIEQNVLSHLENLITKYKVIDNPTTKDLLKLRIIDTYDRLLKGVNEYINKKYQYNSSFDSAEKAYKFIQKKIEKNAANINKLSHNFITRFLKEKLIKTIKSNKTSATRLEISSNIDKCINILDTIMNSLEKDFNIELLKENFKIISDLMLEINTSLDILTTFYKEYFYSKPKLKNRQDKSQRIENIFERQVRKELMKDL